MLGSMLDFGFVVANGTGIFEVMHSFPNIMLYNPKLVHGSEIYSVL